MSTTTSTVPKTAQQTGGQAVVEALLKCGITTGFGIPSIHNIGIYDALRQEPAFRHWIVRHEQAAGFAADAFYRRTGKPAVIFASTGPGNLFTVVPLLESLQTNTPVVLIGTNVATHVLDKSCGALHETPRQLEIIAPLTKFAKRAPSADSIAELIAQAANAGGPAFVEVPTDLLYAPVTNGTAAAAKSFERISTATAEEIADASAEIERFRKPVIIAGSGALYGDGPRSLQSLAESLNAPVLTTTSGKGAIADDHPLSMGCISRLGVVQQLLLESDVLITVGAKLTEFDTGRFTLKLPERHIRIDHQQTSSLYPATIKLVGDIASLAMRLAAAAKPRTRWFDVAATREQERMRIEGLQQESYAALMLLRSAMKPDDVLVNDQSILNYWASAFFAVLEPRTFLYPTGSGTLGYALPAAIGAASAEPKRRVLCIAGDGGFQYTSHELATLAHYQLPVKILLVNDNAYGIIGFLQRSMFGHAHEVDLKNPDFCRLAEAYGIPADRATDFVSLEQKISRWLESPGPSLLEWKTVLKAPWEAGAIIRPTNLMPTKEQR
ncbi:MAG TPA: thiamine pyrophosphate-binding protein [Candidatus Angelobacter sp.]|jgi:acetolactate synthase-1/2/3 large subunit|nr:thiamine pyrophosphate-binding protein [Candidatus Angelobacter sp.]